MSILSRIMLLILLIAPGASLADSLKSQLEDNLLGILEDSGAEASAIEIAYFNSTNEGSISEITKNPEFALANVHADAGSGKFSADVMADGKETVNISGRFHEIIEVPVPSRNIEKGEMINEDDIKYKNISKRSLRKTYITSSSDIVGMQAKKRISANKPINNRYISKPLLIKKGSLVSMLYNTKYIELKTLGQALEDGIEGQIIRLRNQDSSTIVTGKVTSSGSIKINYGENNELSQIETNKEHGKMNAG